MDAFLVEGEAIIKVDKLMEEEKMKTVKQVANVNGCCYVQPKNGCESLFSWIKDCEQRKPGVC